MRILMVVNPERNDMYSYLGEAQNTEYVLLWEETRPALPLESRKEHYPIFFSKEYYWQQFLTPAALLRHVRPDKIVFMEIIDLRQIALIVAAKDRGISTFYLEHGAAGSAATARLRWEEVTYRGGGMFKHLFKRLSSLWSVAKSKAFYYSVLQSLHSADSRRAYFMLPLKMLSAVPPKVLSRNIFPERVPQHCIVFSRINLEEFAQYTGITESQALLTGVPFFDKYYAPDIQTGEHITYIDHPYFEESVIGWTAAHHAAIAQRLFAFAASRRQKLYIKLHPRSDKSLWEGYSYEQQWVSILQTEDCTQLYLTSKLILGFSSSLTTAFLCAHKNFVLLGWNPEPMIVGMNFADTGLCHSSLYPEELESKFDYWVSHNLSYDKENYARFLYECNDPFDGRATERVISAIHTL